MSCFSKVKTALVCLSVSVLSFHGFSAHALEINEDQVNQLIENDGAIEAPAGGVEDTALANIPFGKPGAFVLTNVLDFDKGTELKEEYFQSQFGGFCPAPPPPPQPNPEDEDDGPPQPPPPPPQPEPNPKKRGGPGVVTVTPPGDQGGKVILELLSALAEATFDGVGFNPLSKSQVDSLNRSGGISGVAGAGQQNAAPPQVAAPTISTANGSLGAPPSVAYFFINPITDTIVNLPNINGSNLAVGTDNATDAFAFPFNTQNLIFTNPPVPPGFSVTFPVGSTYVNIAENTATGDRYRITITVNLNSVAVTTELL